MRKLLFLVLVVAIAGAGAAAWSGVVQIPYLSAAFGVSQPRVLGEQAADITAYQAWAAKLGIQRPSPATNYTFNSYHDFSGSVAIDETIPEAVIMGIPEFTNPGPSIGEVHMRFHNGYAETSAMVDLSGFGYPFAGPVYFIWTPTLDAARTVTVAIDKLTFGNIAVPSQVLDQATTALNSYLATRLMGINGLDITALALVEGGVHFTGTVPKVYEANAPAAGQLP